MIQTLEQFTIRILTQDGRNAGTGFVLTSHLAVTCAHVVQKAGSAPGKPIAIQFCLQDHPQEAMVLSEGWSPVEKDDVAFLRLAEQTQEGIPLRLGETTNVLNHDYCALGFPNQASYQAHWALGKLASPVPVSGERLPVLQFEGKEIEGGMSGAAVFDLNKSLVVGMVCEYYDRPASRKAYAITAETIQRYCPDKIDIFPSPGQTIEDVSSILDWILSLLKEQACSIQLLSAAESPDPIYVFKASQISVSLTDSLATRLINSAHQFRPQPSQREQVYLARFILDRYYNRWEKEYLPLAGRLSDPRPITSLRLRDAEDQSLSSAGEMIEDISEVLTKYHKTRIILLGDPGSGKSTTLDRLALDMARQRLSDPLSGKIPLRVDLEEFFDTPPDPSSFLRRKWQETGLMMSYDDALLMGQVCFLLDGLNQMPFTDRYDRVERWSSWVEKLPKENWVVFTCRSNDYHPRLPLPEVSVQDLTPERIQRYLELHIGEDNKKLSAVKLQFERCLSCGDHRFNDLARNIFWLSLLAGRAIEEKGLTHNRAVLMKDLIVRRLDREFERRRQPEKIRSNPDGAYESVQLFLKHLAYRMQVSGGATAVDAEKALEVALEDHSYLTVAEAQKLAVDSGLLEQKGARGKRVLSFYHHLLQEYYAGQELLERFRAGEKLESFWLVKWKLPDDLPQPLPRGQQLPPPPVTGWEETTRMAAAQAGKDLEPFVEAVAAVNLPLAGRCLAEARPPLSEMDDFPETDFPSRLAEDIAEDLKDRQRHPLAHLRARIDAGLALGELGHPDLKPQPFSFEGKTLWAIPPKMQKIRAGKFFFGSSPENPVAFPNEIADPRYIELPAYEIGRYPVTNAEFRLFLEAGGYDEERWWDEAGWEWRQGKPQAHQPAVELWLRNLNWIRTQNIEEVANEFGWRPSVEEFWKEMTALDETAARQRAAQIFSRPFDQPAYWDDPGFSAPARPVVGVNWHEACAYCRWLSALTRRRFELPGELYWEKAARGEDGREYPWGDYFSDFKCNTVESQIYTTTPVGLFAESESPFGLFDAAGNVWEWCKDEYDCYPGGDPQSSPDFGKGFRVVRGGSWVDPSGLARCAFRSGFSPVVFGDNLGFRVFSPGLIPDS